VTVVWPFTRSRPDTIRRDIARPTRSRGCEQIARPTSSCATKGRRGSM
jgi:hypothetical protein